MIGDISYKEYNKKDDIHGCVLYPAVMVAPVQKDILDDLIKNNEIKSVFDPFHGSGTSLYESMEISDNIKLVGCDINPLANLITKVKLQGVSKNINNDIDRLKSLMNSSDYEKDFSFYNMKKWFREDIIEELKKIRSSIMKIDNTKNRLFFWCMMCDIIRKYSNTRSSTYKLHIKSPDMINRIKNNVIQDYINHIEENYPKFKKSAKDFIIYKCDILEKIKSINNNSFDISITSPPYGDNDTTVTYGQFSILSLYWIDSKDLELEGWELTNYSIIDSNSIGGKSKYIEFNDFEKSLISPYLKQISIQKQKKVISFFIDYFCFLKELCRVTNKFIVMTLGNRTVDGIKINLTEITNKYIGYYGFTNRQIIEREIPTKRTPKIISKLNDKIINSMNSEFIIINEKIKLS